MWNIKSISINKVVFRCEKCSKISNSMHRCNYCNSKKLKEEPAEGFKDILNEELDKLKVRRM
jgi:Zn finger protein HypA/HybF involved in hydrogenase expression